MGRVVVHLNNGEGAGPSDAPAPPAPTDPLVDYREYLTRYIREDSSSRRMQEDGKDEGGDDSSADGCRPAGNSSGEEVGGPCCSSAPGCSKYGDREPRRRRFERPCARRGLRPPGEDGDSDSDDDRPLSAGSPLHFCTIGRARFSGLTVPFFHRVPQVTDACVHAVCSGGGGRPPRAACDIATLRAEPREPAHACRLQTLVLRHYPKITDQSLYVLARLASLRYLDVTGTSVTAGGVKNFRLMRPDVEVSSDHDLPVEP